MPVKYSGASSNYLGLATSWTSGISTIACWARANTLPGSGAYYNIWRRLAGGQELAGSFWNTGGNLKATTWDGTTETSSTATLRVGQWYHLAWVHTSTTAWQLFINGVADHTGGTGASALSSNAFVLGVWDATTDVSNATYADVRIWSGRSLSVGEIRREMYSTAPTIQQGLWAWWPLYNGIPLRTLDFSGNNRNLTLTGTLLDDTPPPVPTLIAADKYWWMPIFPSAATHRTLVAAQGSFALTGNAAGFGVGMPGAQAGFTLAGQAAGFGVGLPGAQGSFALTGQAAGLLAAKLLAADHGSFALNGQAGTFVVTLPAGSGSFTLTGEVASLIAGRNPLVADSGAFTLSGQATGFAVTMPADVGSYVLTGQAATFDISMGAGGGTFTLTGNAASLSAGKTLPADSGTFTLAGQAATFNLGLPADAGLFTISGSAAGFSVLLPAGSGSFTLTGQGAVLGATRVLQGASGSFALSGFAAGFLAGLPGASGSFALTGGAAGFVVTLPAGSGSFTLTGLPADLTPAGGVMLVADPGNFTLTGQAAGFGRTYVASATAGLFTLTGFPADLIPSGQPAPPIIAFGGSGGNIVGDYEVPQQPDPWQRIRERLRRRRPAEREWAADDADILELTELMELTR